MSLDPEELKQVESRESEIGKPNDAVFILEKYKILRSYIEHEDSLLNFRMTWFLTSQGVSGTAYAILIYRELEFSSNKQLISTVTSLVIVSVLCLVGFLISMWSYKSIDAAVSSTVTVRKFIPKNELIRLGLPELTSGGDESSLADGSTLSLGLPSLMKWLWPVLFTLFLAVVIAKPYFSPDSNL